MKLSILAASLTLGLWAFATPPSNPTKPAQASPWPGDNSQLSADAPQALQGTPQPADAPARTDASVALYGNIIFSKSHTTNAVYRIASAAPEQFQGIKQGVRANGGGTATDKDYIAIGYTTDNNGNYNKILYEVYNLSTWNRTASGNGTASIIACDLAYDRKTGNIYGCFNNDAGNGYVFGTLNTSNWSRTAIRAIPSGYYNAVMADAQGQIYAITNTGTLLKVDKATGAETTVGATGVVPFYTSSATIDPRTGRCFWTVSLEDNPSGTGHSYLYEVNLSTGAATQLYELTANDEIVGLYTPPLEADLKAPAAVQNLACQFSNGSLSGAVQFLIPKSLYDGTTASGAVEYIVTVNGAQKLSGTSEYGKALNLSLAVDAPGQYEIVVRTKNDVGLSPVVSKTLWIGPDTPKIGGCGASWTPPAKMFSVNWAAAMGAHSGYIDRSSLTYDVVRLPGMEKVATGLTATRFNDTVADANAFYARRYGIIAHAGGLSSDTVWTSVAIANTIPVPYLHDFHSTDDLLGYTIIDQGNDGRTWGYEALYDTVYNTIHCKHHQSRPKDDWVITPPVTLEAGKIYKFTADMGVKVTSYPEDFEMRWGKSNSVSGLSNELLPKTTISNVEPAPQGGYIKVTETGKYYVGIHAQTRPNQFYIFATNFRFSEGMSVEAPAAVNDLTVVGDYAGTAADTIRFHAPALNLNDSTLTSLDKVELFRDGSLIKTFAAPAPGAPLSYIDRTSVGYHTYKVVPYNAAGAGREAETKAYVGVNIAAAPHDVHIVETANNGEVTLSWAAADTDVDGQPLNPALVTYSIYAPGTDEPVLVASGLKTLSHTFRAVPADSLAFVNYGVKAITAAGESNFGNSLSICVGKPLQQTMTETFADAETHSVIGQIAVRANNATNHPRYVLHNDTWRPTTLVSARGDNGFITGYAPSRNDQVRLMTGKVALADSKPVATFYLWRAASVPATIPEGACDNLEVRLTSPAGLDTAIYSAYVQKLPAAGWNKITLPLDAFAGQTVQLNFTIGFHFAAEVHLDDIFVGAEMAHNLTLADAQAPGRIDAGKAATFTARAINNGTSAATGYALVLRRDGKEVARVNGPGIAPDTLAQLTVTDPALPAAYLADQALYTLELAYQPDLFKADNNSADMRVPVEFNLYPRPQSLAAESGHNGVRLRWNAPDLSQATPDKVTETFEGFTSFDTKGANGWQFLDLDHGKNSSLQGTTLPGVTGQETGFFVLDRTFGPMANNNTFNAVSGTKYLSQFEAYPEGSNQPVVCNDWAILPQLYGGAQTIRFYARSYNPNYPESFEFMTSATDSKPASFTALRRFENISNAWTLYEIPVPAGTNYAAIRCFSQGKMMMHVDDVEFIPAGEATLRLSGYNVWMDGSCVNTAPVAETTYRVPVADKTPHTFAVTAVYDKGESGPSNAFQAAWNGISSPDAETTWSLIAEPGQLTVIGTLGTTLSVFTPDGRLAAKLPAATPTPATISLQSGIYVVNCESKTVKIVIP